MFYNKSLTSGIYPNSFKTGHLTPIYKNGKRTEVANYRGTVVMPNLAKVFERIVHNQLKLIINPRVEKQHHGFVNNRNVEINLIEFCTFRHFAFELGAFYSDVKKTLDTVDQPKAV